MTRDIDPRDRERERPQPERGGRGGGEPLLADDNTSQDPFARDLDLPRGPDRERIHRGSWEGDLRGSDVHVLATVGAFRVVPLEELHRPNDGPRVHRQDVEHLKSEGLVRTMPYVVGRDRTTLVTLTERGRDVLEASRTRQHDRPTQSYYAGIAKPRELAHDARVHQAYVAACDRVASRGSRVRRVVLEQELKRDYQRFLQAPNRGRRKGTGRPERDAEEIARWAREQGLPMVDDHVQFPDVRLECETPDGRREYEDVEVMTPHYRGAHAAAKVRAGFTRYSAIGARLSGASGASRSGRARESRLAEEMLS
ncbi:MAG: hypothetical protein U0Q11_05665 [Vicinamibacterales bacterium]